MIVECYSADVYCDCIDHEYGVGGSINKPDVFSGRNKRQTDRQRRQAGWVRIKGYDVCPVCKTRKPLNLRDILGDN